MRKRIILAAMAAVAMIAFAWSMSTGPFADLGLNMIF
jgi:nitrogen fixation-related uncharacterized protein